MLCCQHLALIAKESVCPPGTPPPQRTGRGTGPGCRLLQSCPPLPSLAQGCAILCVTQNIFSRRAWETCPLPPHESRGRRTFPRRGHSGLRATQQAGCLTHKPAGIRLWCRAAVPWAPRPRCSHPRACSPRRGLRPVLPLHC